jgi:hypothetical protein
MHHLLEGVPKAPKGRDAIAQGKALGEGLRWSSKPRRGTIARLLRPFGAVRSISPNSQGVALGYRMAPLRGFGNSFLVSIL